MTKVKKGEGRFSTLRALREQVDEQLGEIATETNDLETSEEIASEIQEQGLSAVVDASPLESTGSATKQKDPQHKMSKPQDEGRRPGRPRGRRSDPDYTQISAYIPLDLLLDIQNELNQEKRLQRKRTAMNVSELVEDLLSDWLKKRKLKKPK